MPASISNIAGMARSYIRLTFSCIGSRFFPGPFDSLRIRARAQCWQTIEVEQGAQDIVVIDELSALSGQYHRTHQYRRDAIV